MILFGLPSFFITINPADYLHPVVLHFAGVKVNLDEPFEGIWPNKSERSKYVARDPVAAAKFFHTTVQAWLDHVLRPLDEHKNPLPGMAGVAAAYYGTVETQGRGSLHLHMLVWIKGAMTPDELQDRLLNDSTFSEKFLAHLSTIVSEQFPAGEIPVPAVPAPTSSSASACDKNVCSARPTHPDSSSFEVNFPDDLKQIVTACNVHKHTSTCYKYGHKSCRFSFERPAIEVAYIKEGVIFLQRKQGNGWVNNYNDIVSYLLRCNNDIKFISNGKDSKALSFYITDYITKKAMTTHNAFPLIIAAQQDIENGFTSALPNPLFNETQQQNRDLLVKCLNKLTTHSERSGPECASLLLDYKLCYKSHKFAKVQSPERAREIEYIVPLFIFSNYSY
jgi:hypothetical protein